MIYSYSIVNSSLITKVYGKKKRNGRHLWEHRPSIFEIRIYRTETASVPFTSTKKIKGELNGTILPTIIAYDVLTP